MNHNLTGFVYYKTLKVIKRELYKISSISTRRELFVGKCHGTGTGTGTGTSKLL
jgi:hypothetical protein